MHRAHPLDGSHRRRFAARAALGTGVVAAALSLLTPTAGAAADPIPDDGLPAELVPAPALVSTTTTPLQAGVSGVLKVGDSDPLVDTSVQAMAEGDGVMYVGGKFAQVVEADGTTHPQSYLAAFDLTTGAWIDTFRPTLDGTVWDMVVTPSGRLIVGGQFTNINGVAGTSALAMLDPVTGAVVTTWRADAIVTGTTARPSVRAIDIEGPWVYVGGNFTKLTGPNAIPVPEARLGRVSLASGSVDKNFRPNIGGVVYDIDATLDRIHTVGKFTTVNAVAQVGVAVLNPETGEQLPGMATPVFTDATLSRRFYFAVQEVGDQVWLGGSQHTTQVYRRADYSLVRSFVANPNGDGQALAVKDGIVYAGNHSNDRTRLYSDATTWPGLAGATRSDPITWIGAWDDATAVFQSWVPDVGSLTGEGTWDLQFDSTGCLWGGGDYDRGSIVDGVTTFASGFARFCPEVEQAPTVPGSPTVSSAPGGVSLTWTASTDDVAVTSYEVLRNDGVIATGLPGTLYLDADGVPGDRYFVRAVDGAGNRGATTRVLVAPAIIDATAPTAPTGLTGSATGNTVNLSWTAATDDVAVTGYVVQRNGADLVLAGGTSVSIPTSPVGTASYRVVAVDAAGNRSLPSGTVSVTVASPPPPPPPTDTVKPTAPTGLSGTNPTAGTVVLAWNAALDNVGVTVYTVLRNGIEVGQTASLTITLTDQSTAVTWYQVVARDAVGNQSVRTAPLALTVMNGPDVTVPNAAKGLTVTNGAPGEVLLSWTAATDNLGVTSYAVIRNGVELTSVPGTTASITNMLPGTWWFQVVARDAAGNTSVRTAPVQVVVTDRSVPTAPTLPVVTADSVGNTTVSWTASTDDVGVVAYVVTVDGVEVQRLPLTSYTSLVTGSQLVEIRAVDAAGNASAPLQLQLP